MSWYLRNVTDELLDCLFAIRTTGIIPISELDPSGTTYPVGAVWYEPTPWFVLTRLLARIDCRFSDYAFIDFGCGKGRTLLEARMFPFQEVAGIELSSELCAAAEKNICSARILPRRAHLTVVTRMDAQTFEFPLTPCILYFYDPFDAHCMRQLAERLQQSIRDHPRDVVIIFFTPCKNTSFYDVNSLHEISSGVLFVPFRGEREYAILRTKRSHVERIAP